MASFTPKALKARLALGILRKYPDLVAQSMPKTHQMLTRWAARGLGKGGMGKRDRHHKDQAHGATLALSSDHSADPQHWAQFLAALPGPTVPAQQSGRGQLIVASQGAPLRGTPPTSKLTPHLDISLHSYSADGLDRLVEDVPDATWILFCAPDDRVLWPQVDALADARFDAASLVLPDVAYSTDDKIVPHLMPGANALYALNCPEVVDRIFLRAGALRACLNAGMRTVNDIVMHWLNAEAGALCLGRPVIEIPGQGARPFDPHRKALLSADHFHVPTPDGSVPSNRVDVAQLGGVSVVICTKDKGFYISQLVARLLAYPDEIVKNVIIVSNNTSNAHAHHVLQQVAKDRRVDVISYDGPFNFSLQSNLGARHAAGGLLLFLNDDIVPISQRWLEDLMVPFADPAMSATGSVLLYPDETIQHAGMVLGARSVAGHVLRQHRLPDEDFGFLASAPRYVSCLTGAVLLVRASAFWQVGGFDENLALWSQDVDLCLQLSAAGGRLALIPHSKLFHMESLSVQETHKTDAASLQRDGERRAFFERWGAQARQDPFHPALAAKSDLSCRTLMAPKEPAGEPLMS